jgi:hypothetical protein
MLPGIALFGMAHRSGVRQTSETSGRDIVGRPSLRHARARLGRTLATVLGVVLVVPVLAAMPAQAAGTERAALGLIDLPQLGNVAPLVSGAGSISSSPAGLVCDNTAATTLTSVPCSQPLMGDTLEQITSLVGVTLTAVPKTPGWEFSHWEGCVKASGATCTIPLDALGTLLGGPVNQSPTAVFDPICDQLPVPLPGVCEGAGEDTVPPDTQILAKPAATTEETSASFTYQAVEPDGSATKDATFECQLTGPGQPAGFSTCPATGKSYGPLEPGDYTFSVRASDAATPTKNTDPSPATHSWTIGAATGAPQTSLAEKPGRWLLSRSTTISLFASDAETYTCTLDARAVGCGGGFAVLRKLASGTHVFTGAATNDAGTDTTPARAVFTVPVNNTSLKHVKGFAKKRGTGHFLNTYSLAKRKGATLTRPAKNIKRVSLVVTKGKGYGTVKVFLNKSLLKKVSLASSRTRGKQVVNVATFTKRKKGTIRIVTTSKKPVVIEGLGIASR